MTITRKDLARARRNYASTLAVPKRAASRKLTLDQEVEAVNLYVQGWVLSDLRERYGLKSSGPIRNLVRLMGVERIKEFHIPKNQLKAHAKDHSPLRRVADVFGVDVSVIQRHYLKYGFEIPDRLSVNGRLAIERYERNHHRQLQTEAKRGYSRKSFTFWCRKLTAHVYRRNCFLIGLKPEVGYHLDHRYSLCNGYHDGLSIWELCHPVNLQWLPGSENCRKRASCSTTQDALNLEILGWNSVHFNPYAESTEFMDLLIELFGAPCREVKSWE